MNEQMKDGAAVPDNRKWSDQDHRWEYEAQGLLEPEKLADGQDGPEDQAQTIAALTQEVATLKAERDMLRNANAVMFNGVTVKLRKHGDDGKHCWLTPTALYAEVDTLKAALATLRSENERLKQPVSDKEWLRHSSCRAEYSARATRHQVDSLIQSRINPPAPGPTSTEEKAE